MARVQLRCTGSFRLDAGIRRLHRNHKFAEPFAKTVDLSFHHSCRSELTRQGISLDAVTPSRGLLCEVGRTFLPSSACRHAVRTISSPACAGDWRIVSEDSESFDSAFPADYLHPSYFHARAFALITLPIWLDKTLVEQISGQGSVQKLSQRTSSRNVGFSDFPAYSQLLLRLRYQP